MEISAAYLHSKLSRLPLLSRYYVAFSGGLDSHVLLHLCHQLQQQDPAFQFHALHVNHGLQPQADDWAEHCQTVCEQLAIPLSIEQVDIETGNGKSLEALAREARYRVFETRVGNNEGLLMAHHQDDQAETLLLQLFRGAGVAGLAAMPDQAAFADGVLIRPLLDVSREVLEAYAGQQGLNWVDDPSNLDTSFDRNFLRHEIVPQLKQRWPSINSTLSRAAGYQAQASHLLQELAEQDYQQVKGEATTCLLISALNRLDSERQRNLVRYWIKTVCKLPGPDSRHLERIFNEVLAASEDATPLVSWPGVEIRRYRDALYVLPVLADVSSAGQSWCKVWKLDSELLMPDGRKLNISRASGQGLSQSKLQEATVTIRFRQGGETCRPAGRGYTRSLKKLMQEWAIPPWQRAQVPLLYVDDQLAMVVGYCICEPFQAEESEPSFFISQTGA